MADKQPNISLTGEQARFLMMALRTATIAIPVGKALELYLALAVLSQVQPPVPTAQEEKPNEG